MPLEIYKGDIFKSNMPVLVNPVNCVGVMGKGLALEFKLRFPQQCDVYFEQYRSLDPGSAILAIGTPTIIHVATKLHWKNRSKVEWIRKGLISIRAIAETLEKNVALPALGCGLGGLDYNSLHRMFEEILGESEITFHLYIND